MPDVNTVNWLRENFPDRYALLEMWVQELGAEALRDAVDQIVSDSP